MDNIRYMKKMEKRIEVLTAIKPICEAFEITDYDYIVSRTPPSEILRIYDTKICCSCNSIDAIIEEIIGWIFV